MATRRTRPVRRDRGGELVRALSRIEELERRVARLEARLRAGAGGGGISPREAKHGRRRPRCPGCTLELPPGRRGETCVWCGFRFDAVNRLLR